MVDDLSGPRELHLRGCAERGTSSLPFPSPGASMVADWLAARWHLALLWSKRHCCGHHGSMINCLPSWWLGTATVTHHCCGSGTWGSGAAPGQPLLGVSPSGQLAPPWQHPRCCGGVCGSQPRLSWPSAAWARAALALVAHVSPFGEILMSSLSPESCRELLCREAAVWLPQRQWRAG